MARKASRRTLGSGRWLRLVNDGGWEYVERTNVTGVVVVVAVTEARELLLVEQYRPPVKADVIELPAGLVGDAAEFADESLLEAAGREMFEETGYAASGYEVLAEGPPSAGQSTEIITYIRATGLKRKGRGGGVGEEDVTRHLVPLRTLRRWLDRRVREDGVMIDAKLWAGMYFATRR